MSSDDEEIIETSRRHGCEAPFRSTAEWAPRGRIDSGALHAQETLPERTIMSCCSADLALREAGDIDGAWRRASPRCVELRTVCRSETIRTGCSRWRKDAGCARSSRPVPTRRPGGGRTSSSQRRRLRRRRSFLEQEKKLLGERTVGYVMPRERSLDIETVSDLKDADISGVKDG